MLPPGPVAVAVIQSPRASGWLVSKEKETNPWWLVVTFFWPISFLPSSVPAGLEKNWTVKVLFLRLVLGVLSSVPSMTVRSLAILSAEASSGKFCRLLAPVSGSLGSLSVRPSELRS